MLREDIKRLRYVFTCTAFLLDHIKIMYAFAFEQPLYATLWCREEWHALFIDCRIVAMAIKP